MRKIRMYNFPMRGSAATSWKVATSIPDDAIGKVNWHNPSGLTMALKSTKLLTQMNTRNISWRVKAAGSWGWQPYHLHLLLSWNLGASTSWNPQGLSRSVPSRVAVCSCHWMARRANYLTLIFTAFPEKEKISLRQLLWRNLHLLPQLLRCIMSSLLICVTFIS
jgi:hypothetical protein